MTTNDQMTTAQMVHAETQMIARAAAFGLPVDVDPDMADHMGAFQEDALEIEDALETRLDVDPDTGIVLDDGE